VIILYRSELLGSIHSVTGILRFFSQDRQVHIAKKDRFSPREARIGLLEGGVAAVIGAGTMGRIHVEMAMRFRPRVLIVSDLVESRLETIRKLFGKKSEQLSIRLDDEDYRLFEKLGDEFIEQPAGTRKPATPESRA
jgi:hypothetical protein